MTIFGDGDGYGYGYGYHILQACQLITWSVLESVFDGGVPDHDAAVVLAQHGVGQLLKCGRTWSTLSTQKNGVTGSANLDGESWNEKEIFFSKLGRLMLQIILYGT